MMRLASLRCLARPALPSAHRTTLPSTAAFSTTQLQAALPPPPVRIRKNRPQNTTRKAKKNIPAKPTKKPAPGERRAFRKRIQLSNNSALVVPGLADLQAENMVREDSVGKMFGLPDPLIDQLRLLEAFKTTQPWGLFRRPHVLLRSETVRLMKSMEDAAKTKKALRSVLTGSRLTGKSMTVLQAMSYALLNKWVVIHIPEAQELTNGHTEYSPIPQTKPVQFSQPVYTLKLLQTIYKTNQAVLDTLTTQKAWPALSNVPRGAPLADLILNVKEGELAWPTLRALWEELTQPGRPPIFFSLDGLSHINRISEYRDQDYNLVHAHDLALVGLFVDALSGKTPLPNGGAVIAAHSESNTLRHPSQELALSQLEAGQASREVPSPDPYERNYDDRVYDALKNCSVLRLEGVSKDETRALLEYWGASGMVRNIVDSAFVAEKWALAGHGNVGELERTTLSTLRM
jgi:small subunit ribosomal protein S29